MGYANPKGNNMKKLAILIVAALLSLTFLAGCSVQAESPYTRSGFLNNASLKTVSPVNEHCEYSVTYEKNADSTLGVEFVIDSKESYLKTDLTTENYDAFSSFLNGNFYLFETSLKIVGTYTINGVSTPVTSTVNTKVWFKGLVDNFQPAYSTRETESTVLEKEGDGYKFVTYKYKVETAYGESAASVLVTPTKVGDESYSVEGGYEIDKIFDTTYIDNEQLLFAPRTMPISQKTSSSKGDTTFSTTFRTIDALKKEAANMKLAYQKEETLKFATGESKRIMGSVEEARTSVKVITLQMGVNSTYSGAAQTLSFADTQESNEYARLIKMEYPATFSTGTFIFRITSSEISF